MDHLKLYAPIFLVVTSNLAVVSYELVLNCSEVSLSGITAYQNTCFAKPPTFDPIVRPHQKSMHHANLKILWEINCRYPKKR